MDAICLKLYLHFTFKVIANLNIHLELEIEIAIIFKCTPVLSLVAGLYDGIKHHNIINISMSCFDLGDCYDNILFMTHFPPVASK